MSAEGLRKVTEGWGTALDEKRNNASQAIFEEQQPPKDVIEVVEGIKDQASISTDGGFVLVREEGWKEVKMVTISQVRPKKETEKGNHPDGRRYKPYEPQMMLENHSYQAGFWVADEMGQHQYLEGLRRAIPDCPKVSSPNDGAKWIARITTENFPAATQIIDWFHAAEKMWDIAKQLLLDKDERELWVERQLEHLWMGRLSDVHAALAAIDTSLFTHSDDLRTAIGYFQRQASRMCYHQYRIAGFPIGSGSVESGINNVVHHRMKRQGRGWVRDNVSPMLAALSELHSGRFDSAWLSTL